MCRASFRQRKQSTRPEIHVSQVLFRLAEPSHVRRKIFQIIRQLALCDFSGRLRRHKAQLMVPTASFDAPHLSSPGNLRDARFCTLHSALRIYRTYLPEISYLKFPILTATSQFDTHLAITQGLT